MKHLKLFFALFAMLALGVGNAWGEKITDYSKIGTGKTYYIGATTGGTDYYLSVSGASASNSTVAGTAVTDKTEAATFVFTGSGTSWTIKFADYANYLSLSSSKANGKVLVVSSAATFTASNQSEKLRLSLGNYSIQKNNSGTQFGSYGNTQTDIWLEEVPGTSEPATTYTIKWHTAKGVTTDVTLNEGATITKPVTDPTMTGYEFMGWTASCDVASDGSDFTALTDFGTADSDKDFYAVFAVATTTGGGGTTTETLKGSDVSYSGNSGYVNFTATTSSGTWSGKGNYNTKGYIQINKNNNNYHIGSPTFASNVTSIKITTTNNSAANRTFYICSSNSTAQPSSGDLGSHKTTVANESFTIDLTTDAKQFYIYSSGAVYISQIDVTFAGGTTTYSDYITTCASDIEFVELGDAFKWSAAEAEVTIDATDNVFPTLTNTHTVPVTYSSTDDAIASIASDGTVTLKKEGSVTITAKYEGGTSAGTGKEYKAKTVTYSLKVNKAAPVASGTTYVKVTSTEGLTDGEYLIVYETGNVAFDGSLEALDVVNNTIEAQISSNTIAGNQYIDAATFTIDIVNGTILSASGKYIGKTANSNGLDVKTTAMENTFAIDANGNAVITGNTAALRYNKTADQKRFRYYKDGGGSQEKIALYKKASEQTVTIATCENGSVSASVANGAKVLSGTTITLSNTPTTGYKLTAYDVYKTGDNTTKVTVTDGKFIMPEHDVTISATFELAKTLTGIEITNAATQTTFWQGETFNHDGLKVTAHFDGAADEDVTDKVTVTGSTATAGAAVEVTVSFTEGTTTKTTEYDITVKATANTKETAYDVTTAREIIDKVSTADNVYVTGIVSEIVTPYNSEYGNITYNISADGLTTSNQLQAFRGKSYNGENFTSADDIQVGDEVVVFGNLLKYSSTYELNAGNQLVDLKRDKQQAGLAYAVTELAAEVGATDFAEPELTNPNGLSVEYSTSDATLATVNATTGEVTIGNKAGTVVITASFAGNDDYVAGEASYTINITDPNQLEVTFDATIDLDANNTVRGEGEITKAPITFACTDGILGNGSEYRIYTDADATFSAAEGYIITKVVLTSTAAENADRGPGHLSTKEGTYTYSGKVGTWVGEAYTVTLSASAQVRATTITVYYKQDNRVAAGLAWTPATISLTVGDAFTAPTFTNPNSVTGIEFTSSNTELATVDNTGVISLVNGKKGSATITATYAGNETYKPADVTCVITVNPKSEKVVILAQLEGQWYAMTGAYVSGKTNVLAAIPVEYINGTLYNVAEADKASIEWQRSMNGNKATFKNGDNYLTGGTSGTDLTLKTIEFEWDYNGVNYLSGNATTKRTFLYCVNTQTAISGFKNYAISNAGSVKNNSDGTTENYSSTPEVVVPVYATATIYTREDLTAGNYGTICYENNITNFAGVTFYAVAGREGRKVIFDEVTELEAGMPYLFRAEATALKLALGDNTASEAGKYNSLQGTFTQIDPAEENILTGNYVMYDNMIKKCGKNCGLKANRAYFIGSELESLGAPAPQVPGRKRVSMDVLGEDEATGVDNITENGVVAPALQGTYDVVGRQLVEPATTGFYIVNGKKVLVVK